ncbi:hypothetical protein GEV26_10610 [Aeromicrobium yanjiei]|uniref:PKD domain-containing protein n=1 Tax=Aeromicrobium yanjiei TaxID=2662028 RepID=A0A5Q2MF61_9ACTN|nr:hypothetical protein GEV26_10610 [Aeromicrobium yanjiei]
MKFAVLILALAVLLHPSVAVADIDVDPNRRNTSIRLDAQKILRPSARHNSPNVPVNGSGDAAPVNDPTYDRIYMQCRVDPVNAIYGCRTQTPEDPDEPEAEERRELTPGDVLRAAREIGLPSLQVQIQPGDETLVNVETIFYAQPQAFERSIELLGYDVDLVAQPVTYHWVHGDGTTRSTSTPGKPYPAMDVTHRYREPADDVRARVDVTYRVRYRVDGGAWQTIGQTLVASGPAAQLDVREAAPVLTRR